MSHLIKFSNADKRVFFNLITQNTSWHAFQICVLARVSLPDCDSLPHPPPILLPTCQLQLQTTNLLCCSSKNFLDSILSHSLPHSSVIIFLRLLLDCRGFLVSDTITDFQTFSIFRDAAIFFLSKLSIRRSLLFVAPGDYRVDPIFAGSSLTMGPVLYGCGGCWSIPYGCLSLNNCVEMGKPSLMTPLKRGQLSNKDTLLFPPRTVLACNLTPRTPN